MGGSDFNSGGLRRFLCAERLFCRSPHATELLSVVLTWAHTLFCWRPAPPALNFERLNSRLSCRARNVSPHSASLVRESSRPCP